MADNTPQPQRQLLDTVGLSEHWGGTPKKATLEKWRLTGDGPPYIKLGRCVRYDTEVADAWLNKRMRLSTSETT